MEWLPWLTVGAIGMTGVIIGQCSFYRFQVNRFRREDAARWHRERYRAYAEFLSKTSAWERVLLFKRGVDQGFTDHQLRAAMAEASDAFGTVQILGRESLRNSADTFVQALVERTLIVIQQTDEADDPMAGKLPRLLKDMRETVERQVRRELQIPEAVLWPRRPVWRRFFARLWRRWRPRMVKSRWYIWRQRRQGNLPARGQEPAYRASPSR